MSFRTSEDPFPLGSLTESGSLLLYFNMFSDDTLRSVAAQSLYFHIYCWSLSIKLSELN